MRPLTVIFLESLISGWRVQEPEASKEAPRKAGADCVVMSGWRGRGVTIICNTYWFDTFIADSDV